VCATGKLHPCNLVPRVSVIIPAHNAASSVGAAIESAIAQRFDGAEIVVVDDGSTDSTAMVLERYAPAIKVLRQPNRGPAVARNLGARASVAEYLAFLDADDVWLPGKLAKTVEPLERNRGAVLAYSEYLAVDDDGRVCAQSQLGPPPSLESMLSAGWEKVTSTVVMRGESFERCGGFCEDFKSPGLEDLWTWLLAREQGSFEYVAEPLVLYRQHALPGDEYRYLATRKTFLRLTRERYGSRSRNLRRTVNRFFAAVLFGAALREARRGHYASALIAAARCLCYHPTYPFEVLSRRRRL
jgi:glycosyltransferase involved in cell wall biosynthesis